MTDIRYRAYDKVDKKYYTGFWLRFIHGEIKFFHCNTSEFEQPDMDNIILEQYTGLKDENGKDLDWWVNDILEDEDGYKFRIDYLEDVGRYGFLSLTDPHFENYYFPREDYHLDELKKVGNIHDKETEE